MKVLIATVLATAVVATPVLAQTTDRRSLGTRNLQSEQFYGRGVERPHSSNPAYDVYDSGQYVGSDPDPNVRQQLRRDYEGRW
jgi:hypothetical protein